MKTLTIFFVGGCVLVKLIDHLHETASDDELQYVITERGRFKPIFTLQSMESRGRGSSDVLRKAGATRY